MVSSPSSASAIKVELRRQARERRRQFVEALAPQERASLELELAQELEPVFSTTRIAGGYCPMPSEISPLPAMEAAARQRRDPGLPRLRRSPEPVPLPRRRPGRGRALGLFPASLDSPEVFPDLVLVPLVAIDGRGTRLGQGKGHYDRVLGQLREHGALLIGIGWQVQQLDETIPAEPWDVPLDGFASPDGLEMFR